MASLATDNSVIESQTQGYDALNRPITSTHSRTGASTTNYLSNTADIVASVSDPGNRTTAFVYDNPLLPFPDRLPSVFSALGEKANS